MAAMAEIARETERTERELLEREPSFVTALSPVSFVSSPVERLSSTIAVEGRVFRRLQRFHLLPSELKTQIDMVATYLLAPKVRHDVFIQRTHRWQHPVHLAKAGQGTFVQGRKLLEAILEYLLLSFATNNSLRDAQQLAEGLVLSGFLSPANETSRADDEALGELYVSDDCYYELVAPGATAIATTPNVAASATVYSSSTSSLPGAVVLPIQQRQSSPEGWEKQLRPTKGDHLSVWAVTDGATRAGFVQREWKGFHVRSLLGLAPKMRRCYAVVNKTKHHSLVLFQTDVARRELVNVDLPAATVVYRGAEELKICWNSSDDDDGVEILALRNKAEREAWLLALLDVGAAFLETNAAILSFAASSASLYALRDLDAKGSIYNLSDLRGHVALLTNVPNGSCSSDAKQLSELVHLSTEYEDAGLKVVAFPSAQFGDAEFDTDEELVEHFRDLFGVEFLVLATRDVNGPNARDAMVFCKTRLPGASKSAANAFLENNFVKFLVGRDGQVVKRYTPRDSPLSMVTDIQTLLKEPPPLKAT
uniref:Glutathione peroxidase n=1 Tax=Hyaloperonospora arabidopsidis (strain Emoy2) TaxID=559515 RepID=M4BRZ4_HYAAE